METKGPYRSYRGYIAIMEKKMETTVVYWVLYGAKLRAV